MMLGILIMMLGQTKGIKMTEKINVVVWTNSGNFIADQCIGLMKFANNILKDTEFVIEEKTVGRKTTVDDFHAVFPGVNTLPQFIVDNVKMTHKEFYAYIGSKAPSNK